MSTTFSVVVWSKKGCSYCAEVKQFLEEKQVDYQEIDVTNHEERRDILEVKYGIRHVPVVEIGRNDIYEGITEVGINHLEQVLAPYLKND